MPDTWTGELLGRMHNAGIRQKDLAEKLGYSRCYVSMLFRSKRGKRGQRELLERAVDEIMAERDG